jgi:hypothetical protein
LRPLNFCCPLPPIRAERHVEKKKYEKESRMLQTREVTAM